MLLYENSASVFNVCNAITVVRGETPEKSTLKRSDTSSRYGSDLNKNKRLHTHSTNTNIFASHNKSQETLNYRMKQNYSNTCDSTTK